MRVVTVNANGIRAAARRGAIPWLQQAGPDVLCLQEVRASDTDQLASRPLAAVVTDAHVGRAPTYAARWSDHAPVVVDYDLGLLSTPS